MPRLAPIAAAPSAAEATSSRVRVELGMQRAVDLEVAHPLDPRGRVGLAQQVHELVADAGAGHGREGVGRHRLSGQALGLRIELEPEPGRVAHRAQQARGVVLEAALVEHAHDALLQVGDAPARVVQMAEVVPGQAQRHRVDGEVAAAEVLVQRRGLHTRQLTGGVVGLPPRAREVVGALPVSTVAVPKRSYSRAPLPEPVGHGARRRARVSLDRDVHVDRIRPAQQVAHAATHQIGRRKPLEGRQKPLHAGHAPDALPQLAGPVRHQSRTGIPAPRMRSFASRTVW